MSLPTGTGGLRAADASARDGATTLLSRTPEWERLRELLNKARRGLGALSEAELWELPSLYRRTISDLSLLRSRRGDPQLEQELSHLCNAAHALIYQGRERRRGAGFLRFIGAELPRAVRRRSGYILAAAAVMTVFSVIGWVHARIAPQIAETVLSPQLVAGIETSLRAARHEADFGLAAQIAAEDRNAAAVLITLNNIGVAIRAFL